MNKMIWKIVKKKAEGLKALILTLAVIHLSIGTLELKPGLKLDWGLGLASERA